MVDKALVEERLIPVAHDPVAEAPNAMTGMRLLVQAVQDLSLARDLQTVQQIVRHAARQITRCDGATFVLKDGECCHYADEDAITPLWKGKRFPLMSCISGWAMLHREAVAIPDIYADPRIPHDAYRPTFVKSLVMVPIRTRDPIGAIGNYWADSHVATPEEIALLRALADSTSIALENVQLYQSLEDRIHERTEALQEACQQIQRLSLSDELTGLYNRRGFMLMGEQALRQSLRQGRACALTFADLDGLKSVNDSLGHEVGDAMIAQTARLLRDACRETDVVARLGGDEFCILTVGDDSPQGLISRLRQALRDFNAQSRQPFALSFSLGTALRRAGDASPLETLLAEADRLMYEDKRRRHAASAQAAALGRASSTGGLSAAC